MLASLTHKPNANATLNAKIHSAPFTIGSDCQFRLFVFKNSIFSNMLIVLQNLVTDQWYELDEIGHRDLTWARHAYTLSETVVASERNAHFKILLWATLNSTVDEFVPPYIALDDLSFSSDCVIQTGTTSSQPIN